MFPYKGKGYSGSLEIFFIFLDLCLDRGLSSGYAKRIGVNFPEGGLHLFGYVSWSTEPWLISIGRNVYITTGVRFITHDGGTLLYREQVPDLEITKPISIGNDVYIGNNVIILPGVNIGNNVIIGAGAVVSKDIPDNSVAVGVPARVIKTADEYLEKAKRDSLHLGHLKGQEKDKALMEYYGYKGDSKGIYF
jgi:acetyltransferase-like isoleucine patch superfamily enzyme